MKTKTKISFFILTAIILIIVPVVRLEAMTIRAGTAEPLQIGKTSLVKVFVDNRDKSREINAVEGKLRIGSPSDIVSINTGGSIFNLWPVSPSLNKDEIYFVGGTQSGVFGGSLKLFTIVIKPKTDKPIKISFEGVVAYLNDGTGTKVSVASSSIVLPVIGRGSRGDELANFLASDNTPPPTFTVDLGQEPSLYGGKYFVSFYATDNESGIKKYEVKEGSYPTVQSDGVYVIKDQSLKQNIEVTAIDNADNKTSRTVVFRPTANNHFSKILMAIILFLVLLIAYRIYKLIIKKDE